MKSDLPFLPRPSLTIHPSAGLSILSRPDLQRNWEWFWRLAQGELLMAWGVSSDSCLTHGREGLEGSARLLQAVPSVESPLPLHTA